MRLLQRDRFLSLLPALAFIIAAPVALHAEVIHGFQSVQPLYIAGFPWDISRDAFDFATQTVVKMDSPIADLSYYEDEKSNGWWLQLFRCQGAILYVPLEQVLTAPELGSIQDERISDERTFVVKTADGIYAKFAVRHIYDGLNGNGGCCSAVIEYYVQTDGSPSFGPLLALEPSTWGRVKALYR